MTLEQAIEFCLHMSEEQYQSAHNIIRGDYPTYEAAPHFRLASEYKQLADWLKEFKELKESKELKKSKELKESKDTQSVVHCKDCKHRKERHYEESGEKPYIKYECKFTKYSMSDDGFCSFGAKMDGEQNE